MAPPFPACYLSLGKDSIERSSPFITTPFRIPMLAWYSSLGARGKLFFWGTFGVVVNGAIYFMGIWMPILLFVSIGMLFVAALMKSEDSTDI